MGSNHEIVRRHLEKNGWAVHAQRVVRGRRPDIVAEKNGKLAMIEVKGSRGSLDRGIEQTLHFKNAANYAYLAIPDNAVSKGIENLCRELGIGLIAIDGDAREITPPQETKALDSVRNRILHTEKKNKVARRRGLLQTLFRSKIFVRILSLLFLNQTREYYLNELAEGAGMAPSTALRELNRMGPLGIITRTRKGTTIFYKINRDCVIHEELKQIFLKLEIADEIIAKELERYDITYALVYGSFARGAETETSDIDLLVIGEVSKDRLYESISVLENKIGREINAILWNTQEFNDQKKTKSSFLNRINLNEILMVRGDEDGFKKAASG